MKSQTPDKISIVVVEDHRMFREHLAHLIEKAGDMVVTGEADNIRDGFTLIQQTKPQLAIVDISLRARAASSCSKICVLMELRCRC